MVIAPRPMRDTSRLARWAFFIVLTPVVRAWLVGMAHSSAMDERRGAAHHEPMLSAMSSGCSALGSLLCSRQPPFAGGEKLLLEGVLAAHHSTGGCGRL